MRQYNDCFISLYRLIHLKNTPRSEWCYRRSRRPKVLRLEALGISMDQQGKQARVFVLGRRMLGDGVRADGEADGVGANGSLGL